VQLPLELAWLLKRGTLAGIDLRLQDQLFFFFMVGFGLREPTYS
jgi:hypothetical protein